MTRFPLLLALLLAGCGGREDIDVLDKLPARTIVFECYAVIFINGEFREVLGVEVEIDNGSEVCVIPCLSPAVCKTDADCEVNECVVGRCSGGTCINVSKEVSSDCSNGGHCHGCECVPSSHP